MVEVRKNVALKSFNTWRTGGNAEYFVEVFSFKQLYSAVAFAKKHGLKITMLGGGSNVLVANSGVSGLVIKNSLAGLEFKGDLAIVESGYNLIKLVKLLQQQEFCDMVWASGIPGSVGGATIGNAGAFLGEMAKHIEWVEVLKNNSGDIVRLHNDNCLFSYRKSGFSSSDIVVAIALKKGSCCKQKMEQKRLEYLNKRKANQPGGFNAGSVFKNPVVTSTASFNNKSAGALIEAVGLKGHAIGGARISDKHANFIINYNNATSCDIEQLIALAKQKVKQKFKIELVEEIRRI